MLRLIARYGSIVLLVAACGTGTATPSNATPSTASSGAASPGASPGQVLTGPNAGHVLFGDAYDRSTFVISGPTTQAPRGHDVAFVAHFSRRVAAGQVHLLVVLGGRTILDRAIAVTNGPWSVYGLKIPGSQLTEPGVLLVRLTDDGSALLSTGSVTITQGSPGSPAPGSPAAASPAASSPSPS